MRKAITLIFVMLLLVPTALASHINNDLLWNKTIVYIKDTAKDEGILTLPINISGNPLNSTNCAIGSNCIDFDGVDDGLIIDNKNSIFNGVANRTFCAIVNLSDPSANKAFYSEPNTGAGVTEDFSYYFDSPPSDLRANLNEEIGGSSSTNPILSFPPSPFDAWTLLCAGFWWNGNTVNVTIYMNATQRQFATSSHTEITGKHNAERYLARRIGGAYLKIKMDNIWIGNITPESEIANFFYNNGAWIELTVPAADTTPPEIIYYNLTSSTNGCENWNTNKSNPCSTSSVTPTVQFNTSENVWCAVAGSSSSTFLNLNYTDMGNSRNCTGAASGEGTKEHFCTLTSQDELVYDTSYLFISCKDSSNNQNLTSTSGALKLSITGLESAGRTSIGLGIQNALLNSYTNYTDQQIYARNLANNQVTGTFDRAAVKGNKTWAFNRIGISDSHVNMFNLTHVLYTLEFTNTTSARITNLTELLINATK